MDLYSLANKLWLKVADVAAIEGDYYKAIEKYERVAEQSINNNLMKYSVKDYLLKAGICHLASGDLVAAQRAREDEADAALLQDVGDVVAGPGLQALVGDVPEAERVGVEVRRLERVAHPQLHVVDAVQRHLVVLARGRDEGGRRDVGHGPDVPPGAGSRTSGERCAPACDDRRVDAIDQQIVGWMG